MYNMCLCHNNMTNINISSIERLNVYLKVASCLTVRLEDYCTADGLHHSDDI